MLKKLKVFIVILMFFLLNDNIFASSLYMGGKLERGGRKYLLLY